MRADTLSLNDLFHKDVRCVVPTFQRSYVWKQDEQWEPLWEDVRNAAERYLDERDRVAGDPAGSAEPDARARDATVLARALVTSHRGRPRRAPALGRLRHRIGNLPLVNRRLSNTAWAAEQGMLDEHSVLRLGERLMRDNRKRDWDEDGAHERGEAIRRVRRARLAVGSRAHGMTEMAGRPRSLR